MEETLTGQSRKKVTEMRSVFDDLLNDIERSLLLVEAIKLGLVDSSGGVSLDNGALVVMLLQPLENWPRKFDACIICPKCSNYDDCVAKVAYLMTFMCGKKDEHDKYPEPAGFSCLGCDKCILPLELF